MKWDCQENEKQNRAEKRRLPAARANIPLKSSDYVGIRAEKLLKEMRSTSMLVCSKSIYNLHFNVNTTLASYQSTMALHSAPN